MRGLLRRFALVLLWIVYCAAILEVGARLVFAWQAGKSALVYGTPFARIEVRRKEKRWDEMVKVKDHVTEDLDTEIGSYSKYYPHQSQSINVEAPDKPASLLAPGRGRLVSRHRQQPRLPRSGLRRRQGARRGARDHARRLLHLRLPESERGDLSRLSPAISEPRPREPELRRRPLLRGDQLRHPAPERGEHPRALRGRGPRAETRRGDLLRRGQRDAAHPAQPPPARAALALEVLGGRALPQHRLGEPAGDLHGGRPPPARRRQERVLPEAPLGHPGRVPAARRALHRRLPAGAVGDALAPLPRRLHARAGDGAGASTSWPAASGS